MSGANVVPFYDFDLSTLKFGDVRKNSNNGKTVYIGSDSGNILLELPKLKAPFGLNVYEEDGKKSTYSLSLNVTNEKVQEFLAKVDELVFKQVSDNCEAYLGKKMSDTVLKEAVHVPLLKQSKDPKYAPSIKLKVLRNEDGSFVPEVFDDKANEFDLMNLQKGQNIATIVRLASIWVAGGKFGTTLRLEQVCVFPIDKLKGFAFKIQQTVQSDEEELDDEIDV